MHPGPQRSWFRTARALCWLVAVAVFGVPAETVRAQTQAGITTAYLSDVPSRWLVPDGNPLELWARAASSAWGQRQGVVAPLKEASTNDQLERMLRRGEAHVVPMQAYELVRRKEEDRMKDPRDGRRLELEAIAIVSEGRTDPLTQFVTVRNKRVTDHDFKQLQGASILVHGGSGGELVWHWLDLKSREKSGLTHREFAEFRAVPSAQKAILGVYFGEVEACVVTQTELNAVLLHNPAGLRGRLAFFPAEEHYAGLVMAVPKNLPQPLKDEIKKLLPRVKLATTSGIATLVPADEKYFLSLSELMRLEGIKAMKETDSAPRNGTEVILPPLPKDDAGPLRRKPISDSAERAERAERRPQ